MVDFIKELPGSVTAADIICITGLLLFGVWLLKTSFGRRALADSMPRRNNMPAYLPLIPLFVWFGAVSIAVSITRKVLGDLPEWQSAFIDNLILCIGAIAATVVIIFLARATFARRLAGLGLNVKTIHRDFPAAVVNLLTIWPLVTLMIMLTGFLGRLIWGQDFVLQQHKELETIMTYPQSAVRVMITITAVAVIPVFEEMLFRGLFQTVMRSFLTIRSGPWLAILISSGLFAAMHANAGHWPALFVLATSMGYAYEKSGSLFRPIFIHSIFNAISVAAALSSA